MGGEKERNVRKPTRKLDILCSDIVRTRGKCAKCGCDDYKKLETAHIFSRKYRSVRWNLLNMVCLCKSCHFWAHANPLLWGEFLRTYLSKYNLILLKKTAQPVKKWTMGEMQELWEKLTETPKRSKLCNGHQSQLSKDERG